MLAKVFSAQAVSAGALPCRCFIESRNHDYSVVISLSLAEADMWILFSDEVDPAMGVDALGEIVNILGGCLFGRPNFRALFGWMRASVPSFSDGGAAGENPWIVMGVLKVESVKLFLELVVSVNEGGSQ